ncbi:hypothetical protein T492DRAFT_917178 [Pavlovales sp. CCMP2436]|nr:hypothetical protein T492DRAFT_917178 [Pavlovales sp. CCMP2436]
MDTPAQPAAFPPKQPALLPPKSPAVLPRALPAADPPPPPFAAPPPAAAPPPPLASFSAPPPPLPPPAAGVPTLPDYADNHPLVAPLLAQFNSDLPTANESLVIYCARLSGVGRGELVRSIMPLQKAGMVRMFDFAFADVKTAARAGGEAPSAARIALAAAAA